MLRIGIFGAGLLGKSHLDNWLEIPGTVVVGFYEPDEAIARIVEGKLQLPRFTDADELIDASDAIDVADPVTNHFDCCQKAIRKGKHVLVEKPWAHTMEEALQLVKLAKEAGIKFHVGQVERFNPAFLAIGDMPLQPQFIEVQNLAPLDPQGVPLHVVLDLMIHDIDIILSLVKSDVKTIAASAVAVISDTPDIATVRIDFDNGCVASLTSSRIAGTAARIMKIYQKDICIDIDYREKKVNRTALATQTEHSGLTFEVDTRQGKKTFVKTPLPVPDVNAVKKELEEFTHAIQNTSHTVISEMDGLMAMNLAYQVLEKIGNNVITHA